jgi:hypothetical protein
MDNDVYLSGKLVSFNVASNKPAHLAELFDNLQSTAGSMQSFEVLVKADIEDPAMQAYLESEVGRRPFEIRYIVTPRLDGYYSLHKAYNDLWRIADPQTPFLSVINDEVRFRTTGWDLVLGKYVNFYPDGVFRLRISDNRMRNYYSLTECFSAPENYPFVTRTWLELTEGWGEFWGPDAWHQAVEYFLGFDGNSFAPLGVFRGVPVFEIRLGGQEAGLGWSGRKQRERVRRIRRGWWELERHHRREDFLRLARRLQAHIETCRGGHESYVLEEDMKDRRLVVRSAGSRQILATYSFRVDRLAPLKRHLIILRRRILIALESHLSDATMISIERIWRLAGRVKRSPLAPVSRARHFVAWLKSLLVKLLRATPLWRLAGRVKRSPLAPVSRARHFVAWLKSLLVKLLRRRHMRIKRSVFVSAIAGRPKLVQAHVKETV